MEQVNVTQPVKGQDEDTKDTDPRQPGTRTMDPELRIMGQMSRVIEELPLDAQMRVISWLRQRSEAKCYAKEAQPAHYPATIGRNN